MKKRILAMLLAVVMIVGLLPVTVFADNVPENLQGTWTGTVVVEDVGDKSATLVVTASSCALTIDGVGSFDFGEYGSGYFINNETSNGLYLESTGYVYGSCTLDDLYFFEGTLSKGEQQPESGFTEQELTVFGENAEDTQMWAPVYTYYGDTQGTAAQYVIPESKLTSLVGKQITALKYYTNTARNYDTGNLTTPTYKGYMGEASSETLSEFMDFTTATTVFEGSLSELSGENSDELVITLDTPYTYTGGNLAIAFECTVASSYCQVYYYSEALTGGLIYREGATYYPDGEDYVPKTTIAYVDIVHTHTDAAGQTITFEPWEETDSLPTEGNWYLTKDVTLSAAWTISKNVNLCLNDCVIDLDQKGSIVVSDGTAFALYDCGKTVRYYDKDGSTGLWTLNKAKTSGDYTTTGGVITGGAGMAYGGGVNIGVASFTMNGGTICGNEAWFGGGVYVGSTFTMNGGTICGNVANTYGGGVENDGNNMYMYGGTITGNTCAANRNGGGIDNCGTLTLGGTAVVKGNFKGTTPNDVENGKGKTMTISADAAPEAGMSVGLYGDYSVVGGATEGDEKYFFANEATSYVKYDSNKITLDTITSGSKITVNSGEHGVVYADKQFAVSGAEITLEVVPDEGYRLKSLTASDADGAIEIKDNKFTMRAKPVTVTAAFRVEGPDYLSVTNTGTADATLMWNVEEYPDLPKLQYSTDCISFNDVVIGETEIPLAKDATVYFRGNYQGAWFDEWDFIYLSCEGEEAALELGGDITTLLDGKGNVSSLENYTYNTFFGLFNGLTALTDASALKLPSTTLQGYCYSNMFSGCTSLTTAPTLPATTMTEYCYNGMFSGCTSLTTAPALPAMTLEINCYNGMFSGCTKLTTAPALPAMTLRRNCYYGMFSGCEALETAPALPATALAMGCYSNMFSGCTSLTTAPALPAMTLEINCYDGMFSGCEALVNAPALPAMTLAENCYNMMFNGCKSLVNAPALPATTLEKWCYGYMFQDCTSLVNAPALPAMTLSQGCYQFMFKGCTSLETAPALPATALSESCYYGMFHSCPKLNSITIGFSEDNIRHATTLWLYGAAASGVAFVPENFAEYAPTNDAIPTGWTVIRPSDYHDITNERPQTAAGTYNGYLTVDKTNTYKTDTVTVTVTPGSDYQLKSDSLLVKYDDGEEKTIKPVQDEQDTTKYTFTMPGYPVTVTAEFKVFVVAKIGDTEYASLEEALAAAQPGETVVLLKDADEGTETHIVKAGVTLDLNGFDLTSDITLAFGTIKDSGTEHGKLIVAKDHLVYNGDGKDVTASSTASILPVWQEDGYIFCSISGFFSQWNSKTPWQYKFAPDSDDIEAILSEDSEVKLYLEIRYKKKNSETYQTMIFIVSDELQKLLHNDPSGCIIIKLNGTDNIAEVKARGYVKAEQCSFTIGCEELTYEIPVSD